jgi:3-deoxy-D-manno-octulosonic acid kinase
LIEHPDVDLFDIDSLRSKADTQSLAAGRSHAVFFHRQGHALVLKHYQRGGGMAALLGDKYIGRNCDHSRSFREWRLLRAMRQLELPVPAPVAAHCSKHGLFYRADLITLQIQDVIPLADHLMQSPGDHQTWVAVGRCLRQFHDASVYHADLNARNILLEPRSHDIHLIDFDKGAFRYFGESWKAANLARLQRSLLKFKTRYPSFNYDQEDWSALLEGYRFTPNEEIT